MSVYSIKMETRASFVSVTLFPQDCNLPVVLLRHLECDWPRRRASTAQSDCITINTDGRRRKEPRRRA
ncbi:uncharacterized [Tachysurus ichikawai]